MATAVIVVVPAWAELRRCWLDAGGGFLSDEDYERVVAQHTSIGDPASSYTLHRVADAMWGAARGTTITDAALTSAGEDDHLYLIYPEGLMRCYGVIRALATMDAPTGNPTIELFDADADFTGTGPVLPGDTVVLASGSTAKVEGVTATTLTCRALSLEGVFAAGAGYYVVRSSSVTDAATQHTITGRPVDWRLAQRWVGERLLQHFSTQRAVSAGGGSTTPPEVETLRQRLSELRGVRGR